MLVLVSVTVGVHVSLQSAFIVVACVNVTVVGFAVVLAGAFPLTFVHPLNTYPLAVIHVALIVAHELYLYVHAHATLATPFQAVNVNTTVSLPNHAL